MKENYVMLVGMVKKMPSIIADGMQAMFALHVLRRNVLDEGGCFSPKYDRPVILAADPDSVREIMHIRENDIVMVKGTVNTRTMEWNVTCPNCGEEISCRNSLVTVYPAPRGIKIIQRMENGEAAAQFLRTVAEFSNICKIHGRVCVRPECYDIREEGTLTKYQIAVNRKLYVQNSNGAEDHTDYPWVYSYGKQAEEDALALSVGSELYMDGFLHTKKFTKTVRCPKCGTDMGMQVSAMNITPYSVEYGEGCKKPDPIDRGTGNEEVGPAHEIESY